jgi:ankyrin repeat protein
MVAAKYDSKEVAELLIKHGAEVSESPIILENGSYYYPLSAAAEWNAKKVAETLLKHGAEIDTDDVYDDGNPGLLPIDYAIQNNSKDIVELFLDHGYKIYNLNIWEKEIDEDSDEEEWELVGTDPIAYAEEHNFTELAELLKKHLKKS